MAELKYVNEADFQREVLNEEKPVLVDFTAGWCPPCRMVDPIVKQLAADWEGKVKVVKLDADQNPNLLTLLAVDWPGRMQRVPTASGQTVLLDGAHNPASADALRAALQAEFPDAKPAIIFGVFRDKDSASMCHSLAPLAGRILLTPVHSERTEDPARLVAACREANPRASIEVSTSLAGALERAGSEPFVVITGSLYLVGEAMELLGLSPANGGERALNAWTAGVSPR